MISRGVGIAIGHCLWTRDALVLIVSETHVIAQFVARLEIFSTLKKPVLHVVVLAY